MKFRTIKSELVSLLGLEAAGAFRVIGYQSQAQSAEEVKGNNRLVQVFFERGNFNKAKSAFNSDVGFAPNYRIYFTVSQPAKVDLATLNSETSTPAEKQTVLANLHEAADLVDQSMDELFELVYQILMDARNQDLGLGAAVMGDRWISELAKDEPIERGDLVVLTGSAFYSCSIDESITGATGTLATDGIHNDLDIYDETGTMPDPNDNLQVTVPST